MSQACRSSQRGRSPDLLWRQFARDLAVAVPHHSSGTPWPGADRLIDVAIWLRILAIAYLDHLELCVRLTPRWSGRVEDKVPSSNVGVRAAQLNR